jgi:DNA polymerase III epsilon subunit family exonuclease
MGFIVILLLVVAAFFVFRYFNKQSRIDLSVLPEVFIVADVETTGLNPEKDEIIEIAAIKVNRDSDLHQSFVALVKSTKPIPKKITKITGISQEMLDSEGQSIESAMHEFLDFIGDLRLVFYNAPFDISFLEKAASRINRTLPNQISDALKMARKAFPNQRNYKLSALAKTGNLDACGAHRALKDCRMTMVIYAAAARRLGKIS